MATAMFSPRFIRFGIYEADLQSGELRKGTLKLKLSGQPFQVLAILQRSQPQHGSHGDNLCFLIDSSAGCAQDEDLCERLAELVVTGSNSMVLPSPSCPDGDGSIEIGIP